MPEHVAIERGAHANEPLAVIDQQPQVELDAGQLRDGQALDAFAQRRPSDGDGVDAIRLAAVAPAATRARHQPRPDANDALAADEQEPPEGARDVTTVLQRPEALIADPAGLIKRPGKPLIADLDRLLAAQLAAGVDDRGEGVRALVHVRTEHDHGPVPFHLD
jgi:hypothetical protein